jgi:hypothetical protein
MSINFSGLHRSMQVPGNSTAPSPASSGPASPGASVHHQFAASAGLTSRKGLQPGHKLPPPRSDALRSKLAHPRSGITSAAAAAGRPPSSAPVSLPPVESAPPTSTPPATQLPITAGQPTPAAARNTAAAPLQAGAQTEPRPRPSVSVPGQPAVFAWLPMQRSSAPASMAASSTEGPRFLWAHQATR